MNSYIHFSLTVIFLNTTITSDTMYFNILNTKEKKLGSTTQSHFKENQSEFITDFLLTDSTLRDELLKKVSTTQAAIKKQNEKITEIEQLDYSCAK